MSTAGRSAFRVLAWDLARVSDLYRFHAAGMHGAEWGIKGHNRPWIVERGDWAKGMRLLDVGAGFSDLAAHLAERFDVDAWVADDFGAEAGERLWSRWGDPRDLVARYPRVHYVFRNLGQEVPELPDGTFDRVYSISVLEHVPSASLSRVLAHMARLLKPGGRMLHTVDLPLPRTVSGPGLIEVLGLGVRTAARRLLIALGAPGHRPYIHSVEGWAALLRRAFRLRGRLAGVSTSRMLLDHDVLLEPPEVVYRFYPPNETPKGYWRAASLTFILQKLVD